MRTAIGQVLANARPPGVLKSVDAETAALINLLAAFLYRVS